MHRLLMHVVKHAGLSPRNKEYISINFLIPVYNWLIYRNVGIRKLKKLSDKRHMPKPTQHHTETDTTSSATDHHPQPDHDHETNTHTLSSQQDVLSRCCYFQLPSSVPTSPAMARLFEVNMHTRM